jgi:hypothetical protein
LREIGSAGVEADRHGDAVPSLPFLGEGVRRQA